MNLDNLFGPLRSAGQHGVREWEARNKPHSIVEIDHKPENLEKTKAVLSFMVKAQADCVTSNFLCRSVTMMWLVDASGMIRLAVEEATDSENLARVPILRHYKVGTSPLRKLGHPSLLDDDKRARIGGELCLRSDGIWELNNVSGRYGINCGRTELQLQAVANVFSSAGLQVDVDFIG